jgi:hypothetical protein
LNNTHDEISDIITQYDLYSIEKENDFRDYTYLLIISMKTFLDLFACLVDITITQKIKPEDKMASFNNFAKSKSFEHKKIAQEFDIFRDKQKYPWIDLLDESRNRIIHRGYHLRPEFHFKKGNELSMILYKGTNLYYDTLLIEVGKLFDNFMVDMNIIEEKISNMLISTIDKLENQLKIKVSYKFGGGCTEFSFCEI